MSCKKNCKKDFNDAGGCPARKCPELKGVFKHVDEKIHEAAKKGFRAGMKHGGGHGHKHGKGKPANENKGGDCSGGSCKPKKPAKKAGGCCGPKGCS